MNSRHSKLIFVFGLATIVALLFYVVFRIVISWQSISGNTNIATSIAIIIFLLAEIFILLHGIGYFSNIILSLFSYTRPPISYNDDTYMPAVDILIPVHDEPYDVVFKTIVATEHIDYDNFRIIIIDASEDDSSKKAMQKISRERGVSYFDVPYPRHGAKAGAINECLKDLRAPYLAIFDADYRPSRDFLKLTVPQMTADDQLGFIQTPQFYGNLETIAVSKASQMQQSIFYEYICEGKSIRSAMFMCGTNLLIRTHALRSIHGFVETSITEDFATSLNLIQNGWKTKYYNQTAAFGDGPRNIREFFRQQYRWARGTLGVFFTSLPTLLFSRRLSRGQRIEFLLSGSYYMVGIVWLILMIAPVLYILFGIPVYMASPTFYLWAYVPYFLLSLSLFVQTLVSRHYSPSDWLKTESLALLAAPVYAKATLHALIGKKAHFEKTNKAASIHEIPWDMLSIQIGLVFISTVAFFYGIWQLYLRSYMDAALIINLFWCAFHLFLLSYFLIYVSRAQTHANS